MRTLSLRQREKKREADRLRQQQRRADEAARAADQRYQQQRRADEAVRAAERAADQRYRQQRRADEAARAAEQQRARELRERKRAEKTEVAEEILLEKVHDASGSVITANSARLAPLGWTRRFVDIVNRRLEAQEQVFVQLLTAAGIRDAESNNAWLDSAHCLHLLSANYETLPEFVSCLQYQCVEYCHFLDRLHADDLIRLPRYDAVESYVADIARLGWTREQLEHGGVYMLPDYDNVAFTDGLDSRDTRVFNRDAACCGPGGPLMIRTSCDILQMDVRVSSLDHVPPQANAAKHRSADGLWESRRFIIRDPPTGDFPGLDEIVATNLWLECDEWLMDAGFNAYEPYMDDRPTHWDDKASAAGGPVVIDPNAPGGILV